jgi:aryl-alcohol dehydrogenase
MIATAAVTEAKCAPFVLQEGEICEPRANEVLVKVTAAGICHTDLICRDAWYPVPFPTVFGCGIQTGAGAVLNTLRVPSGASLAVFGVGAVGLAAVMAGQIAGCATIVAVDLRPARLELARELGATHVVQAGSEDAVAEIRRITGAGVDFSLEATGNPQVLRQAVDCTAPLGVCGVIGAPAFGTEVTLDVNTILVAGRTVRGVVEGDSVPQLFLPQLVRFWEEGRFPVERLMTCYDFDRIEEAAHDAENGAVVKPVLRMSDG